MSGQYAVSNWQDFGGDLRGCKKKACVPENDTALKQGIFARPCAEAVAVPCCRPAVALLLP
jgi:hypothetical protein